jgi:putative ABC transport system substrate-binding protein
MHRRAFITLVAGSLLATPREGGAQSAGKIYRIGYLTVPSRETAGGVANTFKLALRELGWIEGQNIVIDFRFADSDLDRLPNLAAELALTNDVIVAGANAAVVAVKNATPKRPIVMLFAIDPVASGLVASLARPGGNVTGLTVTVGREIYGKQLQLLKDVAPRISRVAILMNAGSPSDARAAREREIEIAARALRLQRQVVAIRDPGEIDNAFAAMKAAHCDALFVPVDGLFYRHRTRLASQVSHAADRARPCSQHSRSRRPGAAESRRWSPHHPNALRFAQ